MFKLFWIIFDILMSLYTLVMVIYVNKPFGSIEMCRFKTKLVKGKALRKHSLHEKTAASVLLKFY